MAKEIIGFHITRELECCSATHLNEQITNPKQLLAWLSKFGNTINLMYSLDLSFACIAHRIGLSREQCQKILDNTKLWIEPLNAQVTYIPGKFCAFKFGNSYNSPYAMYANCDQYITCEYIDGDIDHCMDMATRARNVGNEVYNALKVLKINSENLISPVNQFARAWLKRMNFPTVSDIDNIDERIGEYFYNALEAGLFESPKKGHWDKVWDYDIRSAYGASLSMLPDIRDGTWEHVAELVPDAPIGVYNCIVKIDAPFSPIGYRTKEMNFTPTGEWNKYLTIQQIQCIKEYKLGTIKIEDGFVWRPKNWRAIYQPLMKRLFEIKEDSIGIRQNIMKRVITGIWGLTGQMKGDRFGDYFSPVYHAMTEINTRLKVFETCMHNNIIPIAIRLDGIVVDRPLENINLGIELGQWKLTSAEKKCICVNADLCLIEGVDTKQLFSVTYDWLKEEIENNQEAIVFTMTRNSPMTVGKAVQNNRIDDMGKILPTNRSVNVNYEVKRLFKELPSCGKDILIRQYNESVPLDVDMVKLITTFPTDGTLTNTG